MTILTVNRKEFEKRVGKVTPELEEKITNMGTPIEEVTEEEVSVEVFPNRPDLLSLGNFSRAVNQFIGVRNSVPSKVGTKVPFSSGKGRVASFKINKPEKDFVLTIDKSVKAVRPYSVCAIVRGLKLSEEKIKEIIDIQEKLHNSLGRKRKKLAIGIYPLDRIKLPIKFVGRKPEDVKFLPLESKVELNGRQILRSHPVGREYADLLKDEDIFPFFVDADGEVLSMPPIINSEKTGRIDERTKDIFIECSGHNLAYLKKCLNIIVAAFYEMGGNIYAMNVKDSKDGDFISPNMDPEDLEFKIEDIEKTLGIKLIEKDVRGYLARMGIGMRNEKGKTIAEIPAYRTDILHWIDLTEEVAMAYGYENFEPEIPDISTIAEENSVDRVKRAIGNILAGLGFLECSSYHLTTKKNIKKMHYDFKNFIELEASKTERDVLRMDLMTNLLQIFSENSDAAYPQKIFELGRVFKKSERGSNGVVEYERLGIAMIDEKMGFTEMKQVLDYLFKMLGVEYELKDVSRSAYPKTRSTGVDSNYIVGRCGGIIVNGIEVGRIGEVAPRVLKNWKIKFPVAACELDLEFLFSPGK